MLPKAEPPANLLTLCPEPYRIDSPALGTLVIVTVQNARLYHDMCARHRRLVQWVLEPEDGAP